MRGVGVGDEGYWLEESGMGGKQARKDRNEGQRDEARERWWALLRLLRGQRRLDQARVRFSPKSKALPQRPFRLPSPISPRGCVIPPRVVRVE